MLDVVTNRVDHKMFPSSICGVVKQLKAFSWYLEEVNNLPEDSLYWVEYLESEYSHNSIELEALKKSIDLARKHIEENPPDRTGGALYYMTSSGLRRMRERMHGHSTLSVVDDHLFINNIDWR